MRWLLVGVAGLALAACSQAPQQGSPSQSTDAAASEADAPGINVTAAPGVAFTYRYGFRLPSDRIAQVQEAHAQACEKLGIARCRITGMRYRLIGENNIEGEMDFKLDPALARGFGKQGITGVERAGGKTVDVSIAGTDAAAQISSASTDRARAADELQRLDAAIAKATTGTERAELQAQRADIANRVATATSAAADARDSLATTPVTFDYGSGPAVRGFDTSAPLTSALDTAVASVQFTLTAVLALLAIFGPPALVIALIVFGVLRARAALRRRRPAIVTPTGGE
ncbi:hypothetical protein [Sphingomonas sp.]|uniref:hypothetical protein n=1 Tax=Sphingomonas sp. TaxID=28214 RepID=UPI003B005C2A